MGSNPTSGYPSDGSGLPPSKKKERDETRYAEDEQNTAGLVAVLMVGVTSIFLAFAGAALCYRLAVGCSRNHFCCGWTVAVSSHSSSLLFLFLQSSTQCNLFLGNNDLK